MNVFASGNISHHTFYSQSRFMVEKFPNCSKIYLPLSWDGNMGVGVTWPFWIMWPATSHLSSSNMIQKGQNEGHYYCVLSCIEIDHAFLLDSCAGSWINMLGHCLQCHHFSWVVFFGPPVGLRHVCKRNYWTGSSNQVIQYRQHGEPCQHLWGIWLPKFCFQKFYCIPQQLIWCI